VAVNSGLLIVGLTLLLVAAVSRRLSSSPITPPMVVVAVGILVGPLALDDLTLRPTSSTVRTLAEATLAVVLFSDGPVSTFGRCGASLPFRFVCLVWVCRSRSSWGDSWRLACLARSH
jgi:hypothetical protein